MKLASLLSLAGILAVLAVGAAVLDWFSHFGESAPLAGRSILGRADLTGAGMVLVETAQGQVTLRRDEHGWVVVEHDAFAADTLKLRDLLLELARTPLGPRVAIQPQRLGELGLLKKVETNWAFEAGKTGSVLSVIHGPGARHKAIFQVLIGNLRQDGTGTYVRFPTSNFAYLVAKPLVLDGRPEQWIRRHVFSPEEGPALRRVHVVGPDGAGLWLARAGADAPWTLAAPAGEPSASRVRELTEALLGVQLRSVSARGAVPRQPYGPARVESYFADGRIVTLHLQAAPDPGQAEWPATISARMAAQANDAQPVRQAVDAFNRHFDGRTVALDAARGRRLLRGRAAYLAEP